MLPCATDNKHLITYQSLSNNYILQYFIILLIIKQLSLSTIQLRDLSLTDRNLAFQIRNIPIVLVFILLVLYVTLPEINKSDDDDDNEVNKK